MRYPLLLVGLGVALGAVLARELIGVRLIKLMEQMMERVMPRMMDACFGQMSPDRREFMLAHCRRALDAADKKYTTAQAALHRPQSPVDR